MAVHSCCQDEAGDDKTDNLIEGIVDHVLHPEVEPLPVEAQAAIDTEGSMAQTTVDVHIPELDKHVEEVADKLEEEYEDVL